MKLLSGNSNKILSQKIAKFLKTKLVNSSIKKFADGEIKVLVTESIRHEDCFIIQPTCRNNGENINVNDSIMELLILIDALMKIRIYY
mgnify:CR=1 FL=1